MSGIVKNTLIYTIGNIVLALSSFILLPFYTKQLSVTEFGMINSMQIFSGIFVIFLTLALERSLYRVYYDYSDKEKAEFTGTILIAIVAVSLFITVLCFFLKVYVQKIFSSVPFYPYFFYTILYSVLSVFITYSQTLVQIKQYARRFITISILMFLGNTGLSIYFIAVLKMGGYGYVLGTFFGCVLALPLALYYIRKDVVITFKYAMLKNSLKFSLPMLPSLLFAWVLNLSDRIFIDHYFSQADVGIYSLGYKISSVIIFVSSAFFLAYNSIFYEVINTNEESHAKSVIGVYNNVFISLLCLCGFGILLFADVAIKLFFSTSYYAAIPIIIGFTVSFIISQISGLFNFMVYQNKKTVQVAVATILSAIVNIGLNFILIPRFGFAFGTLSSIIANGINLFFIFFLAKRNFYIKVNWSVPILLLIAAICLFYFSHQLLSLAIINLVILKVFLFAFFLTLFLLYHKKALTELFLKLRRKNA